MMKRILSLLCLITLSGCVTAEDAALARAEQEQRDMETCRSYGLKPGSEAFGSCRLQLDLARQERYNYSRPYYYGGYGSYGPRVGSGIHYMNRY